MPEEFVIFDTEFTSWEGAHERGWDGPGEEKELVQIGAILVRDMEEVDALLMYIRPRINPKLSEYFIELTGISQSQADAGVLFEDAYQQFMNFVGVLPAYCYGKDDEVLRRNHELYETGIVVPQQFYDVREVFNAHGIDTSAYQSGTIPSAFNLIPPPSAHDALNDARSILMALQAMYTT